jgi:ankyrin repeat protein
MLQYSANVKVVDHEGRNALWYARSSGSMECVELLTNNGCPEQLSPLGHIIQILSQPVLILNDTWLMKKQKIPI